MGSLVKLRPFPLVAAKCRGPETTDRDHIEARPNDIETGDPDGFDGAGKRFRSQGSFAVRINSAQEVKYIHDRRLSLTKSNIGESDVHQCIPHLPYQNILNLTATHQI